MDFSFYDLIIDALKTFGERAIATQITPYCEYVDGKKQTKLLVILTMWFCPKKGTNRLL